MDRARSSFMVLHTLVMCVLSVLVTCTAKVPTPPNAPVISTFWPGWAPSVVA
jgi:hypothetical protein